MTVFALILALSLLSLGALYALARATEDAQVGTHPARSRDGWGTVLPTFPSTPLNR
ncbi:hypothetical protein SAMN06264364_10191 [Quadrisphaera granulorum]|uniref:Uncharacterized protein n=1 Tax=Quadrisphaera granulorum TaxID=317664 RepID=A0A316AEA7_9ACTN|nr:hypothetical protein [Quadrisphaera granulorum]PWJ56116.1 hypothetical protein BXY45_10191 [Quadrisphaera granulorum]SZE94750.1 hypothetical protein SAMN06264364_10191 [Quadrisphaera granulorum]